MRIFISTPINGRHEPTFDWKRRAAYHRAETLRSYLQDDYPDAEIVTPFDAVPLSENCDEAEVIGKCIALMLTCDTVVLDRGWTTSKGCNLEYRAAKIYGKEIIDGNGQITCRRNA